MDTPENKKRELLAEYAHKAWSRWMEYLFSKSEKNEDGTVTIPKWAVERWTRQLETTYIHLSDDEKESDRNEANTILERLGFFPTEKIEHKFKMKILASEGPAFGAYLEGSVKDGEATIFVDVLACLAVDLDPKKCCAEVLAHEVLHACQDVFGEALTEEDIVGALERIRKVEFTEQEAPIKRAIEILEGYVDYFDTSHKESKDYVEAVKSCLDILKEESERGSGEDVPLPKPPVEPSTDHPIEMRREDRSPAPIPPSNEPKMTERKEMDYSDRKPD